MSRSIPISFLLLLLASSSSAGEIKIAGATLPGPLYSKMFEAYQSGRPSTVISYNGVGSTAGQLFLKQGTIDFAASDSPARAEIVGDRTIHVPATLAAVVLTYNLPELKTPLQLSGPVIARIFQGGITRWNDQAIQELNPGVTLPARSIIPVSRKDSSGTSSVLSDYLGKVHPEWLQRGGKFTAGIKATGNSGLTDQVAKIPGAIGYTEITYALRRNLPVASVRNRQGAFVAPTIPSVIEAAAAVGLPKTGFISLTNPSRGYPISTYSYLVFPADLKGTSRSPEEAAEVLSLARYMVTEGQRFSRDLNYAPLPQEVADIARSQLAKVMYDGKAVR